MALSDVLMDAAIDLQKGAQWYGQDDYPVDYGHGNCIEWVENLARLIAVAAGVVQDGGDLPEIPHVPATETTTFAGPQLAHPNCPLEHGRAGCAVN